MKLGLKLYSTEIALIPAAKNLQEQSFFDFIELYVVPNSYKNNIDQWMHFDVQFLIHAPHTAHGVNLANSELLRSNMEVYQEVKAFSDALQSKYIIVHGGSDGTLEEVIHQLGIIEDDRVRLENKPLKGLNGEICRGCSPEEFRQIDEYGVLKGIVLDFGHAIYYSSACGLDYRSVIRGFMEYSPSVYHLSDGIYSSQTDKHLNIEKGEFNIKELIDFMPEDAMLSLETPRYSKEDLQEFADDVNVLKKYLNQIIVNTDFNNGT